MADTEVPESLAVALNNSIGTKEVSEYFLNLKTCRKRKASFARQTAFLK